MGQPAIRDEILNDLEKLPAELQRRVQEIVHAMVLAAQGSAAHHDVLRFAAADPLASRLLHSAASAAPSGHSERQERRDSGGRGHVVVPARRDRGGRCHV